MTTKLVLTIAVDGTPVVTGKAVIDDGAARRYSKEEFDGLMRNVADMFTPKSKGKEPEPAKATATPPDEPPRPTPVKPDREDRSEPVSVLAKKPKANKKKSAKS